MRDAKRPGTVLATFCGQLFGPDSGNEGARLDYTDARGQRTVVVDAKPQDLEFRWQQQLLSPKKSEYVHALDPDAQAIDDNRGQMGPHVRT
ncbi:MAG: hypothetical protein WDN72_08940 [Alphaproteobacteria bacterium]